MQGAEVVVHPADLTVATDVTALFSSVERRCGRLDLLFNNAGCNGVKSSPPR